MFYVYEHWRPDKNECFYVGKGKVYAGKPYRAYSMSKRRNRHHRAIVDKLREAGLQPEVRIVFNTDVEDEAFAREIERIALWRRLGVALANSADGGGRNSGWKLSDERKRLVAESKKGNTYRLGAVLSEETRQKISAAHMGKKYSQEYKDAMSIACAGQRNGFFGKTHDEETRRKVAESNRRRTGKPRSKPSVRWTHTEESKKRFSIAAKKRWAEWRAKNASCSP
jgi:hypothetical protein